MSLAVLLCFVIVLRWAFMHAQCYSRERGIVWTEAPIHEMRRECPPVSYPTNPQQIVNICMTTLTDRQSTSTWQRALRCRDFDDVHTLDNHRAYAQKHGYRILDASSLIDTSRPPAWSKIKAVQQLLQDDQHCDWVFWLDADMVVMNSSVSVESFLPDLTDEPSMDLLVTYDRRLTANSGSWLIRNTPWSMEFLERWWELKTWVRSPGLSLSGDNAAFGHLVGEIWVSDQAHHIQKVPRCTFNSFAVFLPEGTDTSHSDKEEWWMSENFYHKGDFVAHASGIDQKAAAVAMLLERAT